MPTNAMISLLAGLLALSPLAAAAPQHMPRGSTPELTLTAQLRLTDRYVSSNANMRPSNIQIGI